jgi:hypothetical protein
MSMRYENASWMRPFSGAQGAGFGSGTGSVTGDVVHGELTWANFAQRREDGAWCPSLRGCLTTPGAAEILVAIDGISVLGDTTDVRRAILARVELTAADERFRWLNTSFLVGEGEYAESEDGWWLDCYVAVNDVVSYLPAIGEPPPPPYRQG